MLFTTLDQHLNASIQAGLNSAQLLIAKDKKIIKYSAYGDASLQTIFDIASLTKIFSITYLVQYYVDRKQIDLSLTLKDIFPELFTNSERIDKENITIQMLLAHEAGFEPNPLFYDKSYSNELFCQNRDEFLIKLLSAPLIHVPQSQSLYSDVDFMLLTLILERLYEQNLEAQLYSAFPFLNHARICYNPLIHGYTKGEIAPTELHGNTRDHSIFFENIRTSCIHGEVQDEKAYYCMQGMSGHAGLFANCEAIYHLLQLMTNQPSFFSPQVQHKFLQGQADNPSFGLGWRLNKGNMTYHFGDFASPQAYGHTGWTGCVCVVDPLFDLTIIYLTNRKHSKVLAPTKNPHRFLGDILWAGQYKNIMNTIYQTLGLTLCGH